MNVIQLKKIIQYAVTISSLLLGEIVFAHDSFSESPVEGTGQDINLNIPHGCNENPIIAQSVVFPTVNPELSAFDHRFRPVPPPSDISEVIEGGNLEGLFSLIQDKRIFRLQRHKRNALTNAIGFYGTKGKLSTDLRGRIPFEFSAPFFLAESCAIELHLEVGIADICSFTKPIIRDGKVNLFIPDNGSQYAIKGAAAGIHGIGETTRLIIRRDLQTHPLDKEACGKGITVVVTPSAEDVDANLGIPGWHL